MDDSEIDRQFTPWARENYSKAADALISALRSHVDVTLQMEGRQREIPAHMTSAFAFLDAARAFDDAEFNWCGSFPLALPAEDDEEDDEDWDSDEAGDLGETLSVFGRWDFRITDITAVIDAGRSAYLGAWPEDTQDDAEVRVGDPQSACMEIMHGDNVAALSEAPGLSLRQFATQILIHDGDDDFDEEPFGPVAPSEG